MSDTILAAIIGGIFAIVAAVVGARIASRKSDGAAQSPRSNAEPMAYRHQRPDNVQPHREDKSRIEFHAEENAGDYLGKISLLLSIIFGAIFATINYYNLKGFYDNKAYFVLSHMIAASIHALILYLLLRFEHERRFTFCFFISFSIFILSAIFMINDGQAIIIVTCGYIAGFGVTLAFLWGLTSLYRAFLNF